MLIRNCNEKDVDYIRRFVNECKPLLLHTAYTFWVLFYYFKDSCFVMEEDKKIVGFVSGLKSTALKDTFLVWQIGVLSKCRGKGYGVKLLERIVKAAKEINCQKIQFSIESDNKASYNLFSSFAKRNGLFLEKISEVKYFDSILKENLIEDHYEIKF